jgi:hypothetical protein
METSTALARLRSMVASTSDPVLSDEEVMLLLGMCQLEDANGVAPTDVAWVGTYDLNRGAAEGWRWKAAKAASRFDFRDDLNEYKRSQVIESCERMAAKYQAKIITSAIVRSQLYDPTLEAEEE